MSAGAAAAYVVDASVVIKLFVSEQSSEHADELFAGLAAGTRVLLVPDLLYLECANILWKNVRRAGLAPADAEEAVRRLRALALHVTPGMELCEGALALALERDISAYDACYVELARRRGVPMITADEKLQRKTGAAHDVQVLGAPSPTE
jgi:predicted nucleic acid-binding protein